MHIQAWHCLCLQGTLHRFSPLHSILTMHGRSVICDACALVLRASGWGAGGGGGGTDASTVGGMKITGGPVGRPVGGRSVAPSWLRSTVLNAWSEVDGWLSIP